MCPFRVKPKWMKSSGFDLIWEFNFVEHTLSQFENDWCMYAMCMMGSTALEFGIGSLMSVACNWILEVACTDRSHKNHMLFAWTWSITIICSSTQISNGAHIVVTANLHTGYLPSHSNWFKRMSFYYSNWSHLCDHMYIRYACVCVCVHGCTKCTGIIVLTFAPILIDLFSSLLSSSFFWIYYVEHVHIFISIEVVYFPN